MALSNNLNYIWIAIRLVFWIDKLTDKDYKDYIKDIIAINIAISKCEN